MRGATQLPRHLILGAEISIHAPLAGCDQKDTHAKTNTNGISIHAPLAGCDVRRGQPGAVSEDFNPRTPCGVRLSGRRGIRAEVGFQSTHPMRGATHDRADQRSKIGHFNPRTPCGVRLSAYQDGDDACGISIHAPHAGCDPPTKT